MWDVKTKVTPVYKRGNWNQLKIVHKMCEQHMMKAHQITTGNSHMGHYVHISKSTNVKVQNVYYRK